VGNLARIRLRCRAQEPPGTLSLDGRTDALLAQSLAAPCATVLLGARKNVTAMVDLVLVKEQQKSPPVGECIYCGSRDDLTDEHIVPFALGGRLVLSKASCNACARITGAFEGCVLRGFMYRARVAGKFQTRKPKDRPEKLEVELLGSDGNTSIVELASADAPVFLQLPKFEAATYLRGVPKVEGVLLNGQETILFGGKPAELLKDAGVVGIRQTDKVDAFAFARMLAKIGYAYFVACNGVPNRASVPVLPFILGKDTDGSQWMGSADFATQADKHGAEHVLSLTGGTMQTGDLVESVTIARVKLFASSGASGYEIVVHRTKRP
jgi:hypothetical protein